MIAGFGLGVALGLAVGFGVGIVAAAAVCIVFVRMVVRAFRESLEETKPRGGK